MSRGTIEESKVRIKELKEEESRARLALVAIRGKLLKEKERLAFLVFGIAEGVVVTYNGKRFKVAHVDTRFYTDAKPWLRGYPMKKNGEWGTALRNLYSGWEIAEGEGK